MVQPVQLVRYCTAVFLVLCSHARSAYRRESRGTQVAVGIGRVGSSDSDCCSAHCLLAPVRVHPFAFCTFVDQSSLAQAIVGVLKLKF